MDPVRLRISVERSLFRLALMSIYNDLTGLRWLRKYFIGRGRHPYLGLGSWAGWTAVLHAAVESGIDPAIVYAIS